MKNYYEILEVDKNASEEIIKVAYKSLVKKYHPDLKNIEEKNLAEEKIKNINDAYDILSDPQKREIYDKNLEMEFIPIEKYNLLLNENNYLKEKLNSYYSSNQYNIPNEINQNFSEYNNNYNNFKFKLLFKEIFITLISIFVTLLFVFFIFKIPFFNKLFSELFNNTPIPLIIILIILYIIFYRHKK